MHNVNVNNKFIEREGTKVSNALECRLHFTEQTGKFLTDAENCLLKVQDHADIPVNCSRW